MRTRLILIVLSVVIAIASLTIVTREVLETVVSPGPLSAAHANLRGRCFACHVPFAKQAQNRTCLACHKDISGDLAKRTGFHGRTPGIASRQCSTCHGEHKGKRAALVRFDPHHFDHRFTDFALVGAHRSVACRGCHLPGRTFASATGTCIACHARNDVHHAKFGRDCAACHDARSWKTIHAFDHGRTGFPLIGLHRSTTCAGCHPDHRFIGTPKTCIGCHRGDDIHHGARGENCAGCHTPAGWKFASFDHNRDTRFPLFGTHASTTCVGCHGAGMLRRQPPLTCIGCHAHNDVHQGRFGTDCAGCHVSTVWKAVHFDHNRQTAFPLRGAHVTVACTACHTGPLHSVRPPTACIGCHRGDDPHHGRLGTQCASCHSEASWKSGVRFDHGLTRFPLLGAHSRVECKGCHADKSFAAKGLTCNACHADSFHQGTLGRGPDCATCHVTSSWTRWRFDHDRQTGFPLDGRHAGLSCKACHRQPAATAKIGASCYSCHRADDVHHGVFGQQCGQCHTTKGFLPATVPARLGAIDPADRRGDRLCPAGPIHRTVSACQLQSVSLFLPRHP
jgi:hypothetical protein